MIKEDVMTNTHISIKDWPEGERPREKLLERGAQALSDAELLAIFLRTGIAGKSAVDLAREQLHFFGGLRPLLEASQQDLCAAPGLGPAKFAQLQAVLEMAKRHLLQAMESGDVFENPATTKQYLLAQMRHLSYEEFRVLYLSSQHQLLHSEALFRGTIDAAAVYPREVVKQALKYNAAAVIIAHNHPSGIGEPSQADISITKRLIAALDLVGIRLLDHLIVGDSEVVSLAERGML